MKKKLILLLVMMSLCVCILGDGVSAKEKQFKRQNTNYKYIYGRNFEDTNKMYMADDGKVYYVWSNTEYDKKNEEYNTVFNKNSIEGKKIKKRGVFKNRGLDLFWLVRVLGDKTLTIQIDENGRNVIREFDEKGNKIFSYKEKKKHMHAICGWDDGKNIYYIYKKDKLDGNSYVYDIRCINKKSKKAKSVNSFKLLAVNPDVKQGMLFYSIKIEKGNIYVLGEKEIYVYSLQGKLLNTCKLPEGETKVRISEDPELLNYLVIDNYAVCGKYVYYCNRNGIYRWNMKGKGGFKLYYNAEGDEYFKTEYQVSDMCVKDENTIYIMFWSMIEYELNLSNIVRYSRE